MTLGECIIEAAAMLNIENVLDPNILTDTDKLLIKCANYCLDEVVSEYLPLVNEKEVQATNGKIAYSLLDEAVFDIRGVYDYKSSKVRYKLMPSYIEVEKDGKYVVQYCTRLPKLSTNDEVPLQLRLTPRIVAYGIAAEYLLISGFYEEAVTYDQRFKDALKRIAYGCSEKRIKRRRWLI